MFSHVRGGQFRVEFRCCALLGQRSIHRWHFLGGSAFRRRRFRFALSCGHRRTLGHDALLVPVAREVGEVAVLLEALERAALAGEEVRLGLLGVLVPQVDDVGRGLNG